MAFPFTRPWKIPLATLWLLAPGLPGAAQVTYTIVSTSGDDLNGTFQFSGSLAADGTFDFDAEGNPLASTSITVTAVTSRNYALSSSGSLTGSFSMAGALNDGTNDFNSSGDPLSSPSFSWTGGSGTNQPNQNDDYVVVDGLVTAMKYDIFGSGGQSLLLAANGSYAIEGESSTIESGTYTISSVGATFVNPSFSNQPNQNDDYVVSGGSLTALKYDLSSGSYALNLSADGTFTLSADSAQIASGTYALTAVPEPGAYGLLCGAAVLLAVFRRRLRI